MIQELTQHIGILSLAIHIPMAQSLKQKRMVVRSLKDRVKSKFNVSVAELDGFDKWQRAVVGFAMIGNDQKYIDRCLQNILSYAESFGGFYVCEHRVEFY